MTDAHPSLLQARPSVREAELAALIAEQESDMAYGDSIRYSRTVSLDAPVCDDEGAGTLSDLVGATDAALADFVGEEVVLPTDRAIGGRAFSEIEVARWIRMRRGMTWAEIAEQAGVGQKRVRSEIRAFHRARASRWIALTARAEALVAAYEAGSSMEDIAYEVSEECGYSSMKSCWQSLRLLFKEKGVAIRPARWKHGARSRAATPEQVAAYRSKRAAVAVASRRGRLARCPHTTRRGERCRRWNVDGHQSCVIHSGIANQKRLRWTRDAVIASWHLWVEVEGHDPRPSDWRKASNNHPSHSTIYNLFGSWGAFRNACAERAA